MATNDTTNTTGIQRMDNFTKLVLTAFGIILLSVGGWMVSSLGSLREEVSALRVSLAEVKKEIPHLQRDLNRVFTTVDATSREQIERTTKFGEINTRLSLVERGLSELRTRMDTIASQLVELPRRHDQSGASRSIQPQSTP